MWLLLGVLALVCGANGQDGGLEPSKVITTMSGSLQGTKVPTYTRATGWVNVNSFYGIPYGKPPVGDLRFAKPEPAERWEGVLNATVQSPHCQQGGNEVPTQSEDCLFVNVFTPDLADEPLGDLFPVMIWFHGGAYTGGGSDGYGGHTMAARGVVEVVVNYRLGNLGFFTTQDEHAWGNWGLHDQSLAMQWVQQTIYAFHGDPNKVTLYGQSAGASSASLHMVSPRSEGLFHQVIAESGTDITFWAVNWPKQNPADYSKQMAESLECPTEDSVEMIRCLRGKTAAEIAGTGFQCTAGHFCQGMAPVVDGIDGFLPIHPMRVRELGAVAKIPLITGFNSEDGSLYTAALIPESILGGFNSTEYARLLRENLVDIWAPQFPDEVADNIFELLKWNYAPWPHIEDEEGNRQAFNHMITDFAFGQPANAVAADNSQYVDATYVYVFGYRSTNITVIEWMGVPHSGELPYTVGFAYAPLNPYVREDGGWNNIQLWNELDFAYTDFIQTCWTNFAKTGNPTPGEGVPSPTHPEEMVMWERYSGHDVHNLHHNHLFFNDEGQWNWVDYRALNYAMLSDYMAWIGNIRVRPHGPGDIHDDWPGIPPRGAGMDPAELTDRLQLLTSYLYNPDGEE